MNTFIMTEASVRWYAAQDEARAARLGLAEVPDLPQYHRRPSTAPIPVGSQRNAISNSPFDVTGPLRTVLEGLGSQGLRISKAMVNAMLAMEDLPDHVRSELQAMASLAGEVVFVEAFFDWRGRVYAMSGSWGSLQNSKTVRACLEAPDAVTITMGSREWEYMVESFRHEGWATTVGEAQAFARDFRDGKVPFSKEAAAELRAARALLEVAKHGETAYLLEQDATCSGFQHIALAGGCMDLARVVNATLAAERGDLYMEIVRIGGVTEALSLNDRKARKVCKPIVMLTGYGSGANAITLSYFNEARKDLGLEEFADHDECKESGFTITFHGLGEVDFAALHAWVKPLQEALMSRYPVIRRLQRDAKRYWTQCVQNCDEGEWCFAWTTRDGFQATRVMLADDDDGCTADGALPNIIHSLDGMVIRRVIATWGGVLGVVHDAFFTTVDRALELRECVREAYAWTHASYPIDFPLQRKSECMPIGMCIGVAA